MGARRPGFAATGLPGIGKTQTAVEFAYRHADLYSGVVWLPADTREGCLAALGEVVAKDPNLLLARIDR